MRNINSTEEFVFDLLAESFDLHIVHFTVILKWYRQFPMIIYEKFFEVLSMKTNGEVLYVRVQCHSGYVFNYDF